MYICHWVCCIFSQCTLLTGKAYNKFRSASKFWVVLFNFHLWRQIQKHAKKLIVLKISKVFDLKTITHFGILFRLYQHCKNHGLNLKPRQLFLDVKMFLFVNASIISIESEETICIYVHCTAITPTYHNNPSFVANLCVGCSRTYCSWRFNNY